MQTTHAVAETRQPVAGSILIEWDSAWVELTDIALAHPDPSRAEEAAAVRLMCDIVAGLDVIDDQEVA